MSVIIPTHGTTDPITQKDISNFCWCSQYFFSTHMFNFYYFVLLWEPQNCHQSVMQFHAISNSKCNFFVKLNSWFIFVHLMVSKILLARNGNQLDTRFEICVCILSSIHNFISLLSEFHVVGGEKSINFIINSSFTQKKYMKRKE